jgi:hypothetical protein
MVDPINVKDCMFFQKSEPTCKWGRKLKYCRLVEVQSKPKGKIQNPEHFALGVVKWGMECTMFNLYG